MDTLFDDDHRLIREAVRDFLGAECTPARIRAAQARPDRIDRELWQAFCELGWAGLCLSEDRGGQGLPLVYLGIMFEELGRHAAPLPAHGALTGALLLDRVSKMPERLAEIIAGKHVLSLGLSDMGEGGARAGCGTLTAATDGEDIVLDGVVRFVDGAAAADSVLASFRLDGDPALAVVDLSSPGIETRPFLTTSKDAQAEVAFANVRLPSGQLIARGAEAEALIAATEDLAVALNVSLMAGGARRTMEFAAEYAKERKAFGHPIGAFQAIQHLFANMLNAVDGTELLVHEAIWRMDQGLPCRTEVSQAKSFGNERCVFVCRSAQQIHGGIGFMDEFDLHLWYRNVVAWSLRWGSAMEHRERIAAAVIDGPDRVRLDRGTDANQQPPAGPQAVYALAALPGPAAAAALVNA